MPVHDWSGGAVPSVIVGMDFQSFNSILTIKLLNNYEQEGFYDFRNGSLSRRVVA